MKTVIIKPMITEKTMGLSQSGVYTFAVAPKSDKKAIALAVASMFNVQVEDVHTVSMHGKVRRMGKRRVATATPNWKKAMVRLKPGQTIEAFRLQNESEQKK
jgi:large subunit ribosomal protein L23